jgi:hypothetical protein
MKKDLTYGIDVRGDNALFVEEKHFIGKYCELDKEVKTFLKKTKDAIFFRVIKDGKEQRGHGWIKDEEVMQWG